MNSVQFSILSFCWEQQWMLISAEISQMDFVRLCPIDSQREFTYSTERLLLFFTTLLFVQIAYSWYKGKFSNTSAHCFQFGASTVYERKSSIAVLGLDIWFCLVSKVDSSSFCGLGSVMAFSHNLHVLQNKLQVSQNEKNTIKVSSPVKQFPRIHILKKFL